MVNRVAHQVCGCHSDKHEQLVLLSLSLGHLGAHHSLLDTLRCFECRNIFVEKHDIFFTTLSPYLWAHYFSSYTQKRK